MSFQRTADRRAGRRAADGDEAAGELAIDAENVHVTYSDGTAAVRGVDLAVGAGEFFGFLGPNGAGKTTTIRTLATLLRPTAGSVSIAGHDVDSDPRAVRESIGYMPQETSVDAELTARENVRFACKAYGVPASERAERVAAVLDLVELADVADRRAKTFSGGMKKRLDAATALVHRPPVLFLDEPTTGLDPEARMRMWDYFEAINERGTTVFLTTQYLEEVDRLCDRVALLRDGEVVATDSPDRLKSRVGGDALDLTVADPAERERAASVVREVDALGDATVRVTETGVTVTSARTRAAASDLFVALDDAGVAVTDFDVRSPTLDDVFLALAGDGRVALEDDSTADRRTGGDAEAGR